MAEALMVLLAFLLCEWARERNECDDCGDQLKWCDPTRTDVPMTRCFTCDGPHPAYIKPEYHETYGLTGTDG